jgi:hypothetical protein
MAFAAFIELPILMQWHAKLACQTFLGICILGNFGYLAFLRLQHK